MRMWRALAIQLRDEPKKQFDGLHTILKTLHEREGLLDQEVLDLCQSIASTISNSERRNSALGDIAAVLAAARQIQQALNTAYTIDDTGSRAYVLGDIATYLAQQKDPQATHRNIVAWHNPNWRPIHAILSQPPAE